jgi:hypothetical protein
MELTGQELTERVLRHLAAAEAKESNPWLRDDLRISWITTKWAQSGVPDWSLHGDQPPYAAATWQVLHCRPDQVWPRIVASRKAKLGSEYALWYDASDNLRADVPLPTKAASSPKKPCASERRTRRREDAA